MYIVEEYQRNVTIRSVGDTMFNMYRKGSAGVCQTYKREEAVSRSSNGRERPGTCTHQAAGLRTVDPMNSLPPVPLHFYSFAVLAFPTWERKLKNTNV